MELAAAVDSVGVIGVDSATLVTGPMLESITTLFL
jgi:hypothetical protein